MAKKKTFLENITEEFEDAFDSILVNEETDSKVEVIPTSSVSLNTSIGVGGIPKGKFTEIFGPESAGKTTLVLDICKNALALNGKILYLDPEHGMNYEYTKQIIGDYDEANLIILQPDTAEDCFRLAEEGISSGEFSLIILDSIGALAPQKEKEDKFEDSQVSLLPRLISKFLRRNHHNVKVNNVAMVFINQLRDKIGAYIKT
jgi:recombination protein RecA